MLPYQVIDLLQCMFLVLVFKFWEDYKMYFLLFCRRYNIISYIVKNFTGYIAQPCPCEVQQQSTEYYVIKINEHQILGLKNNASLARKWKIFPRIFYIILLYHENAIKKFLLDVWL